MPFPILTSLIVLPIAGAFLLLFVRDEEHSEKTIRAIALIVSGLVFAETLLLWSRFSTPRRPISSSSSGTPGFLRSASATLSASTASACCSSFSPGFLTPIALLGSWESVHARVKAFSIVILLLESAMIGVFVSLDLFLFYVFWGRDADSDVLPDRDRAGGTSAGYLRGRTNSSFIRWPEVC